MTSVPADRPSRGARSCRHRPFDLLRVPRHCRRELVPATLVDLAGDPHHGVTGAGPEGRSRTAASRSAAIILTIETPPSVAAHRSSRYRSRRRSWSLRRYASSRSSAPPTLSNRARRPPRHARLGMSGAGSQAPVADRAADVGGEESRHREQHHATVLNGDAPACCASGSRSRRRSDLRRSAFRPGVGPCARGDRADRRPAGSSLPVFRIWRYRPVSGRDRPAPPSGLYGARVIARTLRPPSSD